MECSALTGKTVRFRSNSRVSRCFRVNGVSPLLALMAISIKEIGLTNRTVSGSSSRRRTFGENARSETPPATYNADVSSNTRNSGASLKKGVRFLRRHGAGGFAKLLRCHPNHSLQRPELWRPSRGWLHQFRDDSPMASNRNALAPLYRRQELSQPVLRFGDAHLHALILAILWLFRNWSRISRAAPAPD